MGNLIQPSFAKGEVNPEVYGRVDTASYKVGVATATNMQVRTYGNIQNRPGLEHLNFAISQQYPSRLRRFKFNTGDTYMLEFSNQTMRVILDDAFVLEAAKTISGVGSAYPGTLIVNSHGWSLWDAIEINGIVGLPRLNLRRFMVGSVIDANTITLWDIVANAPLNITALGTYISGGTASRVYTMSTPYVAADLQRLVFTQSADVITVTHPSYPEARLARSGPTNWTLTNPTFAPVISAPVGLSIINITSGTTTDFYQVTALSALTGEESLPSATVTTTTSNVTASNAISWTAVAGVSVYSVYKAVNGVFGFIGDTPIATFNDNNYGPVLSTTPPTAENPFVGGGNYPAASAYFQQRQVRGGSINLPDTAYYSQIGNFYNMTHSVPSADSDAMTVSMTAREVNQIRFFVPGKDLLVFTAGAEWRVNAGTSGTGFSATTILQTPQSSWGCSYLEPIVIGLTTLFVPANNITVRSFTYTYLSDNYTGSDLTLLSAHMFGLPVQGVPQTILSWGYGLTPDPIVYCVRSDGDACVMTYQEDQQVTAWCHWTTQGNFESVDVVRPSLAVTDDYVYFCVTRQVAGNKLRTIERLHTRRLNDVRDSFFVDAGLSYDNPVVITNIIVGTSITIYAPGHGFTDGQQVDLYDIIWQPSFDDLDNEIQPAQLNTGRFLVGYLDANRFFVKNLDGTVLNGSAYNAWNTGGTARTPTQTVIGLDHLEGCAVVALADGNYVGGLTVAQGSITIPFAASRIHVGLKYISDVQTLDLETQQGSIQGLWKQIPYVTVRFNQSRGLFAGPSFTNMTEMKQRQFDAYGDPTALLTGEGTVTMPSQWRGSAQVCLRQRYPLPMDILDIIPELDVGE